MGKPIELTWRTPGGKVVTERCLLVEETDKLFTLDEHKPIRVITSDGVHDTVSAFMDTQVVFEDDNGIFCLDPKNVIHIEILKE